jgi:sec-independent protein translocase protein TatA
MGEFSLTHIILVAFVFLLFFGPSKLPQLGSSLGRAIRGFKEGLNELNGEAREVPTTKNETESQRLHHEQQAKAEQAQRETSDIKKS